MAPAVRPANFNDDLLFAEQCLAAQTEALAGFRALCTGWLRGYLVARGATTGESEAIAETLFVDAVASSNGRPPLLATYRGECPLQPWLARVALNRLFTAKRLAQRDLTRFGQHPEAALETLSEEPSDATEEPVLALLREAIARAFATCEAEQFVMLHLLHSDDLRQEELARMFGCAISTISRHAERAREEVRAKLLAEVRRRDPWLELTWDDLLALCRTTPAEALAV